MHKEFSMVFVNARALELHVPNYRAVNRAIACVNRQALSSALKCQCTKRIRFH